MSSPEHVRVNGRDYRLPTEPVVVVCIDGSEPAYHEQARLAGRTPFLESVRRHHVELTADCAMPSFTNPNNVSIATGAPPSVHGICGNYFFDDVSGRDVMMNDPSFLRAPTLFAAFEEAGVDVAIVTAKDKLRRLLKHGVTKGICFSAEKADEATVDDNGIADVLDLVGRPLPSVYSADLSEFAMAAGVELLRSRRPELMYLTLTDYVQHKFAPGTQVANDFYGMLDSYFARIHDLGATLVITADHGMNSKATADGPAEVIYLQEHLDSMIGPGEAHVVLPITDPYVTHHAALGSSAFVHLNDAAGAGQVSERLNSVPGIAMALIRDNACRQFELPSDRIGDVFVIADQSVALGSRRDTHDLDVLDRPLRSHGGLSEQRVPLIINRPIRPLPAGHRLRNFDAYWLALNFAQRP